MKLLFVLASLDTGGAERVTLNLIDGLIDEGCQCDLLLIRREGELLKYVNPDSNIFSPVTNRKLGAVSYVRSVLDNKGYDLVYSVTGRISVVVALALYRLAGRPSHVVSIHSVFSPEIRLRPIYGRVYRYILDWVYQNVDAGVIISEGAAEDVKKHFPKFEDLRVIYNAAFSKENVARSVRGKASQWKKATKGLRLFSCGRLVKAKGYDLLLTNLEKYREKLNGYQLLIAGDGPRRGELEKMADSLNLGNDVRFLGNLDNPFPYMATCDLYIHPSRWDGLPTTVIEAQACGACVVSTDCDAGPREIIQHGINGILTGDPYDGHAFVDWVVKLSNEEELRTRLGEEAKVNAMRFERTRIVSEYLNLFLNIRRR